MKPYYSRKKNQSTKNHIITTSKGGSREPPSSLGLPAYAAALAPYSNTYFTLPA